MTVLSVQLFAQDVTVQSAVGQSPATFVSNNLLGNGVYVFNVKYNNSSSNITIPSIGTFESNGFGGLSMLNGIVMTSGNISVAAGPNNSTGLSSSVSGYYSDSELEGLATADIYGCSTLDFDFVSLTNHFSFTYCFGSEEYPEWVCSDYNDVFAFFITGPDPVTLEERTWNIAMIPGSQSEENPNGIAVTINSVNIGTYGESSGGGNGVGCYYDYTAYYVDNNYSYGEEEIPGIQYDGYTSKMTAETDILPCVVYHMHISVCNVGDNSYDSGVFLEGNSFSAPLAAIGLSRPGIDTVWGSCGKDIALSLAETDFDNGTVNITFGGTAVEGSHFTCTDENGQPIGSDGLAIDNGSHSFVLRAIQGADLAQDKTIEVYLATSLCPDFPALVAYDTMRFVLVHGGDVSLRDTTITCSHACFEVEVPLNYGDGNIVYQWIPETGIDDPHSGHSTAMIFESTDYTVIATGGSGCNSDTATVHIVITGQDPVGIGNAEADGLNVYPNPASDKINIESDGIQRVELFSAEGKRLFDGIYTNTASASVSTEGLPNGVYYVRVSTKEGVTGTRLVVKH